VAEHDPRNRGAIAFFKPKEVTRKSVRDLLASAAPRASSAEIGQRIEDTMRRIAAGPLKPPPPLSQSLEEVDDLHYGLGTHPDIIEQMWKLDDQLPERCRWVVWGRPALVHPGTGVIFAVGFGTIGFVLRLPPVVLADADPSFAFTVRKGNPGQQFDIAPTGPEWRFLSPRAPQADWCRKAYEFAGADI